MKAETKVYKELLSYLQSECVIRNWKHHIVRVESNMTLQGIPDIYCIINGRVFWIECKVGKADLSPMQTSFHRQEISAGGTVYTVVKKDEYIWLVIYEGDVVCETTLVGIANYLLKGE